MGIWGPMQRQLLNYLAKHPEMKKMVKNGADKFRQSPYVKKAEDRAKAYYDKTVKDAAAGASKEQHQQSSQGAGGGPQFSSFNKMRRRLILEWHKHKGRVIGFVTANFFMIIMAFQFMPALWHGLVGAVKALTAPSSQGTRQQTRQITAAEGGDELQDQTSEKKRRKKKNKQEQNEGLDDEDAIDMRRSRYQSEQEKQAVASRQKTVASPFSHLSQRLDTDNDRSTMSAAAAADGPTPGTSQFSFGGGNESPSSLSSTMFDDTAAASSSPAASSSWWGSAGKKKSSKSIDTMGENGGDVASKFNKMHEGVFQNKNDFNGMQLDFSTSFLVKMGDETEFTSSLDREHLTGERTAR